MPLVLLGVDVAGAPHGGAADGVQRPAGVQRAGRLVGEHDRRMADQCAGDRGSLLLTAGELVGPVVETMPEADALQCLARPCAALRDRQARVQQPARDVVDR